MAFRAALSRAAGRSAVHRRSSSTTLRVSGPEGGGDGVGGSRGLALLLGWAGGSERNLQKHAQIWHRLGLRTAAVTMSFDRCFLPERRSDIADVTRDLLAQIDDEQPSLIVPHVFRSVQISDLNDTDQPQTPWF
jgi:hypothetical protein